MRDEGEGGLFFNPNPDPNPNLSTIQKYEKEAKDKNRESWYMAYIMDTNEEERAKGKTVEVGRAHFATEKRRYTVLDAPRPTMRRRRRLLLKPRKRPRRCPRARDKRSKRSKSKSKSSRWRSRSPSRSRRSHRRLR